MKVRFTPNGDRQFLAVVAHILAERPAAARRVHTPTVKALKRLERFPESGRQLPEFPDVPHREVVFSLIQVLPPHRARYGVGGGCLARSSDTHGTDRSR